MTLLISATSHPLMSQRCKSTVSVRTTSAVMTTVEDADVVAIKATVVTEDKVVAVAEEAAKEAMATTVAAVVVATVGKAVCTMAATTLPL